MTAGKAYLDVRQALADLGLSDEVCEKNSSIPCSKWVVCGHWMRAMHAILTGLDEILVVEEKRQILEYALKEELYNWREDVRPSVYGKFDERDHAGGEWSQPRVNGCCLRVMSCHLPYCQSHCQPLAAHGFA